MKKHFPRSRSGFRLALIPLAIGTSFGTSSAGAQEDNRFYIAPMGTYVLSDDDRHADDGIGGTLAIGAKLGTSAELELRGTYLEYKGEDDGDEDVDISGGGFGVNVFLAGPGGPYVHADVMAGDETLFNIGLGYDITLGSSFGIRAEALYHTESNGNVTGDEYKEPLFNLGVRIPFGKVPAPPVVPPPPPPPVEVVPTPPPPPVCSDGLDNDTDGFVDFPADKGCETADDADETDPPPKCKAPEPGQPVSLDGCGVGDTIVLRGVNFDFDKSTLTVNAKTILDGVAEALKKRPDIKVEIGGHTDAKGSDDYNLKLSGRRSKSVRDYLAKVGVAAERMTSKGYGESMPVADNETDDGRELNRRVELKVTESSGGVTVAPPVPVAEAAPAASAEPAVADAAPPVEAAPAAAAPEAGGNTVTIASFAFAPAELTVPVGTTVTWTNTDGSAHLVVFADQTSDRMKKGTTYTRTFTAAGTYPYTCTIHPTMTGTVIVK
ncbi:MAG: OmpA family protein [Panacagrimonas sp.]